MLSKWYNNELMDYYIEEGVDIPLTGLTMPLFVPVSSYKHRHISWSFFVFNYLSSFCWYWWNCCSLLFK